MTGESSPMASRKPTAQMIWIFDHVGSASHWSPGPPAAAMSAYLLVVGMGGEGWEGMCVRNGHPHAHAMASRPSGCGLLEV